MRQVEGHATFGMAEQGTVKHADKMGDDSADTGADFGRRTHTEDVCASS